MSVNYVVLMRARLLVEMDSLFKFHLLKCCLPRSKFRLPRNLSLRLPPSAPPPEKIPLPKSPTVCWVPKAIHVVIPSRPHASEANPISPLVTSASTSPIVVPGPDVPSDLPPSPTDPLIPSPDLITSATYKVINVLETIECLDNSPFVRTPSERSWVHNPSDFRFFLDKGSCMRFVSGDIGEHRMLHCQILDGDFYLAIEGTLRDLNRTVLDDTSWDRSYLYTSDSTMFLTLLQGLLPSLPKLFFHLVCRPLRLEGG